MIKYYIQVYHGGAKESLSHDSVKVEDLPYQQALLERFAALGVIDIQDGMLPMNQIERVAKILRLRQTLGVNLPGAEIICALLERLEELERELEILR